MNWQTLQIDKGTEVRTGGGEIADAAAAFPQAADKYARKRRLTPQSRRAAAEVSVPNGTAVRRKNRDGGYFSPGWSAVNPSRPRRKDSLRPYFSSPSFASVCFGKFVRPIGDTIQINVTLPSKNHKVSPDFLVINGMQDLLNNNDLLRVCTSQDSIAAAGTVVRGDYSVIGTYEKSAGEAPREWYEHVYNALPGTGAAISFEFHPKAQLLFFVHCPKKTQSRQATYWLTQIVDITATDDEGRTRTKKVFGKEIDSGYITGKTEKERDILCQCCALSNHGK